MTANKPIVHLCLHIYLQSQTRLNVSLLLSVTILAERPQKHSISHKTTIAANYTGDTKHRKV